MARKSKLGQIDIDLLKVREQNLRRCGSLFRMDLDPSKPTDELACRAGVLNIVRIADREEILKKARTEIPSMVPEDRHRSARERIEDLNIISAKALNRCPIQFKGDGFISACQVGTRFTSDDIAGEIVSLAKERVLSGRYPKKKGSRRSGLRGR